MSFMQKQVELGEWILVDVSGETTVIPLEVVASAFNLRTADNKRRDLEWSDVESYVAWHGDGEPEHLDIEIKYGWCARLSAPGYMDCSEWSGPYRSEGEALAALESMYPEDEEDGEDAAQ